jgi:subtilisin family serine protease
VGFKPQVSDVQTDVVIKALQGLSHSKISGTNVEVVSLPAQANENAFAGAFKNRPEVEFVEFDEIVAPSDIIPNDPWYPNEWNLAKIAAPTAWGTTTGSASVAIAVIDTGVDSTHPDLSTKIIPGWNIYDNNANTADVYGHGTMVAGTAAAASNNGIGVTSICWYCSIMPIRASALDGTASYSNIATGIIWAADHGARVANVSYIVSDSSTVTSAAQYMWNHNGLVTASAGNYSSFDGASNNPYILTISASDPSDVLYTWSNTGNNVDLAAPGAAYTTLVGGNYGWAAGTSISSPVVAALAALLISVNPSLTPSRVTAILEQNADDLGPTGWDPSYGWGRVNAARAVAAAGGTGAAPSVSFQSPQNGATLSGTVTAQVSASDSAGISSVSLYVDGTLTGTSSISPYAWPLNTASLPNGGHTLKAIAKDPLGNSSSATSSVTVSNISADATPPTIAINSPGTGSTVSGSVSIQASASDNIGVASVIFCVDGAQVAKVTAAPYAASWNTTTAANGTHTLMATASDLAGNTASASLTVTVNNTSISDTIPPVIAITAPTSGATLSGNVSVLVSATDNVGVVKVQLYVDGALYTTSTLAPFTTKWNTSGKIAKGAHTLQARAYDAAGNAGFSSTVAVYK